MVESIKLSILICTLPQRKETLNRLDSIFKPQFNEQMEILCDNSTDMEIGKKRNKLINASHGKYICFVDDDDLVSKDYVLRILTAIETNPDCVGIQGVMITNANCPRRFFHTIEVDQWYTNGCEYYRTPNHLNPIRHDIVKRVMFNEHKSFGEDLEFSSAVKNMLKTEVMIDDPVYYYIYNLKPNEKMFG